jgi:hypothetical protein
MEKRLRKFIYWASLDIVKAFPENRRTSGFNRQPLNPRIQDK